MKFPVDFLAEVSQAELEQLAHNYVNNLLYSNPYSPEHLSLSDSTQVTIDISSVGFVPLYGSSDKQKILALFSPSDPFTAVALYLLDQWWPVDDILKTADPARVGAVEVETVGDRIVLYILNRVIYRAKEISSEELPFLCHGEKDNAKILWNNGEAVGFYSVKPSGSLCNSFSTRSYQLPIMDSIFVRKCQRGKGFGLQMLEDFVLSFKEDCLGLRYPLTKSMYKVCKKYLCQYPGDTNLLWEVESIGGPNQRTKIANKIQAMDLSTVSKSLSFTEESFVITKVTQKDVVMAALCDTQIKEAESMEGTVENVEGVVILRATKEAQVPMAAQGRSSGSKRRKTGEKLTEDKSEKLIRIEDIEAETPREKQLHNITELVKTEEMFSVAPEEKGEYVVDTPSDKKATTLSDKRATVLVSQDLEEADITSVPMTKEPHVEEDAAQDLNNTSHDSQITVENVASEIEEAVEECQKENTAVLVVSDEVLVIHKEAETLNKVGEGTQIEVTEKVEEIVKQHELSLSTHAASEDGEAGKTGRTVVAIKTVQSETPRRRSQRHRKPEQVVKEETTAQDVGRVLRGRTVMSNSTPKRKYTRRSQKACEELEKKVDEVAEKHEVVGALAVTEGGEPEEITCIIEDVFAVVEEEKQQQEGEQLTNEEETEKQEEPGVKDTALSGSPVELPFTTETALAKENEDEKITDDSEKELKCKEVETSMIQDTQEVTSTLQLTKQSKIHQNQEEEHTDEADLGATGSASRKKADEKATDKQIVESADNTEEEISTEEESTIQMAQEAAEVNMEDHKEVHEDTEAEGEAETISMMKEMTEVEKRRDDVTQEPDMVAAASEMVIPDEVPDEAPIPVAEEPQEKDTGSEILKLQKATVILVDLKTTCHHLSVKRAEERPVECAVPEKEQMELIAVEEKDVSSCVSEEQTSELEMLVLEEQDGEKQENGTEEYVDSTAEAETVEKQELEEDNSDKEMEESANIDEEKSEAEEAPVIETRVFRSGRKTLEASCKSTRRSNQQQEEDNIGEDITEKEVDEAETGTVEVEGEMEAITKNAITVTVPVEEKQSAVSKICAEKKAVIPVEDDAQKNLPLPEVDEAMSVEHREAPLVETRAASQRHKTIRSTKQVDEQEGENCEEEEQAVTIRTLRQGMISASSTTKGKSRRTCKQIQEDQRGEEEYKCVKETKVEEEWAVKEAAVEKKDEERVEKIEEIKEKVKEEAAPEREESLQPEIDVEEGKAVPEEGQEECDKRKPNMGDEELKLPPVAVTRSLRIGKKTSQATPKNSSRRSKKQQDEEKEASEEKSADRDEPPTEPRILRKGRTSVCRKHKQLQKEEEVPKKLAEEEVEEEEKEPPTERYDGKGQDEDRIQVEMEELVNVEVEKEVSEEGTIAEEEENTVGGTAAAYYLVQEGQTDTPSPKPATDSPILKPSAEEKQSERMVSQHSDLQRVTVILEEDIPGSLVGLEMTQLEKVVGEDEGFEEKQEDAVTIQDIWERMAEETVTEDEAKSVDDNKREPTVIETKTQRSRQQAVKAARSGQKKVEEEKGESSEIREEPAVQVRVLRRERKSIPVIQKSTTKRTCKQLQEEEKKEEGGVELTVIEREAEEVEEQQQIIHQEGERLEEEDATEQIENIEPEMSIEKVDTVSEKAVIQHVPEEGQVGSTETVAGEDAEAAVGQSADEGQTLDDVAEEAVTTQDTMKGEQSTSTSELAEIAGVEDKTKVNEAKGFSEEEKAPVITKTRVLKSDEKTVIATNRSKTTQKQEDEQEEESTEEKSTQGNEPALKPKVVRKGRRSVATTTRCESKRAHTQCETEKEQEDKTSQAKEIQVEETKAVLVEAEEKEESRDEKIEEKNEKECAAQREENTEREVEMGIVEAVAGESLTEQETVLDEQSVVSETCAERKGEVSVREGSEESPNTDEGEVTDEEEAPVVETRLLRSGVKAVKARSRSKTTKSQQEENKQEGTVVEKGADTDVDQGEVESATGGECALGNAEQMKDALTENAAVLGKEDNSLAAVDETGIDTVKISSAEVERKNSEEEEVTTVIEKSTAITEVGSDTVIAKEEALVENQSVVAEEEASAVTTRTLRGKTQTSHATSSPRSRRQKTSSTGQETGSPAEDTAEDQAKETTDSLDNRVVELTGEEPATEETESPRKEPSESKDDKTVDSSVVEGRSLRRKIKTVADKEEDKAEEIPLPKRRSIRKRPRVDYRENYEEDEGGETEAANDKEEENKVESDEDKDNKKSGCSANEPTEKLEPDSRQENLGAIESTSEKGCALNLVLDTDEEVETAALSQENKEDEQSMSEEEIESIVIGKKVLRGRSVPSVIIAPHSNSRCCSAKVKKAEESLSDEEKSPQSVQKRSSRKRKSTEVTPTRKCKRHSKV